ncbi:MAG: 1-deoxy-D-xylulose-5-phosphate reductoisomerase [Oscillospiraceae bacterium]|nr:1-deoxy-D-xylulose-5-phosphate reductoisomerase [Oscillospiraceae bacterium]
MKKISILGSTGSIGTQGLEVAAESGGAIEVVAIAGNRNVELLEQQIRKYRPKIACAADEEAAKRLATAVADTSAKIVAGKDGLIEVATVSECDMVLSAIVGFAGLEPTVAAIRAGKNIALANKETLVAAGDIVMNLARERKIDIIPVDSEHSAIFQCLNGEKSIAPQVDHNKTDDSYVNNAKNYVNSLEKILLTASGGPFFGKTRGELENVTVEQALRHPSWSMGAKITIDSATLMNKGLEVIEAAVLFGVDIDDIEVVVHRESIIHSMAQFVDGSIIAQMSRPSMKHPIQYAFTYPRREFSPMERVDFKTLKTLTFAPPDEETFRCLALAKEAGKVGGALPVVMNAANEVAVEKFLQGEIAFLRIADIIEETMNKYSNVSCNGLEDIIKLDMEVRKTTL